MNGLDANLIIANAPDPVFVSDLSFAKTVSASLGQGSVLFRSRSRLSRPQAGAPDAFDEPQTS